MNAWIGESEPDIRSGQCIEMENKEIHTTLPPPPPPPIKCGGENGGKTRSMCGFYAHLIG